MLYVIIIALHRRCFTTKSCPTVACDSYEKHCWQSSKLSLPPLQHAPLSMSCSLADYKVSWEC